MDHAVLEMALGNLQARRGAALHFQPTPTDKHDAVPGSMLLPLPGNSTYPGAKTFLCSLISLPSPTVCMSSVLDCKIG